MVADGDNRTGSDARVLPLFPLTGVLLLPGNYLPLNVFEPRYRNLVEDALEGDRRIGMVQPLVAAPDNRGPVPGAPDRPELYRVGCVGHIDRCERQGDGRYVLLLRGEQRFRMETELSPVRGYRRALADYDEYRNDRSEEVAAGERLLTAALEFAARFELDFDADLLRSLTPLRLLHVLAAALPFGPVEKQALLEAATAGERQEILLTLMQMEPDGTSPEVSDEPAIVH